MSNLPRLKCSVVEQRQPASEFRGADKTKKILELER